MSLLLFLFRREKRVYVCEDVSSFKYHYDKTCKYLKCSNIKTISEDSAKNIYGFLSCPYCTK